MRSLTLAMTPLEGVDNVFMRHPWLLAPYFQGVLMQTISTEYAQRLHEYDINPYSQSVTVSNRAGVDQQPTHSFTWKINALNDEANCKILKIFESESLDRIELKATGTIFKIVDKSVFSLSQEDLANLFYSEPLSNKFHINFFSPAAFKQHGSFVFTPDLRLLIQSLQQKYNAINEGTKEVEPEELAEVISHIELSSYNLKSQYFKVGATRIPAFVGNLQFTIKGSKALQRYIQMLLHFGEFSGVGVKTSMGMGSICIENLPERYMND